MKVAYVIVSIIIFLVVLLAVISFGKDVIPAFNEGINTLLGYAR